MEFEVQTIATGSAHPARLQPLAGVEGEGKALTQAPSQRGQAGQPEPASDSEAPTRTPQLTPALAAVAGSEKWCISVRTGTVGATGTLRLQLWSSLGVAGPTHHVTHVKTDGGPITFAAGSVVYVHHCSHTLPFKLLLCAQGLFACLLFMIGIASSQLLPAWHTALNWP